MLTTIDGLIIGSRDIGENNSFFDILTKEYGVIEVTAHGVKKITNRNAGSCGLFSYAEFCLNKNGLRYSINSASPKYNFYKLSDDLRKLSLAVYFSEVVKYSSASEQNGGELLHFFLISLYELEKEDADISLIKSVFEMRLSCLLGFMPDLRACCECACYEHAKMTFIFAQSCIICGDCYTGNAANHPEDDIYRLSPSMLYTLRYVIYSPVEKLYLFLLKGITAEQFAVFAEKYLLYQLNRSFKTLDYYKKISQSV